MTKIRTAQTRFLTTGFALVLLAVAAGCSRAEEPVAAPTPPTESSTATLLEGDIAPKQLFKLAAPADLAMEKATESQPGTPKNVLKPIAKPETVRIKSTILFVPPGSGAGDLVMPIDSTEDAAVYVASKSTDVKTLESTEKDVQVFAPGGKMRIDLRAPRTLPAMKAASAMKMPVKAPVAHKAASAPGITGEAAKIADDKPLTAINLDLKSATGDYMVKYGAVAGKTGVSIDVRLPKSNIEMDITPSASTMLVGEEGKVAVELLDGATPIANATIEAELLAPDHVTRIAVPVRELGAGKYEALVSKSLSIANASGVYTVYVRAKGASNGTKFNRYGSTGFELSIPTGKIASAGAPRAVTNPSGGIEAFELDVNLDVASLDRYEVSAALVSLGADGSERPVALAQTAAGLGEGKHTLTLRFDAGFVKLTGLEGSFQIRGLQLYSQGRTALFHRMHKGMGLAFPAIKSANLVPLKEITPAIQQLILDGEFDLTKP